MLKRIARGIAYYLGGRLGADMATLFAMLVTALRYHRHLLSDLGWIH